MYIIVFRISIIRFSKNVLQFFENFCCQFLLGRVLSVRFSDESFRFNFLRTFSASFLLYAILCWGKAGLQF